MRHVHATYFSELELKYSMLEDYHYSTWYGEYQKKKFQFKSRVEKYWNQ